MFEVTLHGEQQAKPRKVDADQVSVDPHWVKFTMSQPTPSEPVQALEVGGDVYEKVGVRVARRTSSPVTIAIFPSARVSSIIRIEE